LLEREILYREDLEEIFGARPVSAEDAELASETGEVSPSITLEIETPRPTESQASGNEASES